MDKTFLAINLNDFHSNQNEEPKTNTEIRFIQAKSIESAKEFIHKKEPKIAWVVIPKQYFDKNIVYANCGKITSVFNTQTGEVFSI